MSSRRRSKKLKTSAIRNTDDLHEKKGIGKWLSVDAENLTQDAELGYTQSRVSGSIRRRRASLSRRVGHTTSDGRYELPFVEIDTDEQVDYQRKFDMFNSMLDHDTRVGQTRRQHQYYIHSGVSEDSDYTSDVNYPVGQHGQQPARPTSSASYHYGTSSSSGAYHQHHRQHQHHQLATPQRSLNSSRENSYETQDDDYRNNGQSSYYPPHSSSSSAQRRHRQLPQTLGLSSNHSSQQQQQQQYLTARSHSRQLSHRSRSSTTSSQQQHEQEQTQEDEEYWDDPRDYETDPLYYNSRPQSYKPYSAYRRHDSWDDGYNSYRKEDSYSRQYSDDYEDAQDYCQPSHNYTKRLKNNRRGTHSLERQETLYHDDIPGDYHLDVHDSNSRLYDNDRYSSTSSSHNQYRQHSLQKDSGNDQYSADYGDYGEDTSFYGNEDSTIPQASASSTIDAYDQYEEDNRYSYDDSQEWGTEVENRDHYATTSSSKPHKKLPQIPTQKQQSLRTDSYAEDPYGDGTYDDYGMASTTDDAYYSNKDYDDTYEDEATPIVPETSTTVVTPATSSSQPSYSKQTHHQQYQTQPQYQNQQQQQSQYESHKAEQQPYQTSSQTQHQNHKEQKHQQHLQDHHQQSQDYYDTSVPYESQSGYDETWDYNGYYDEAGNFIPYNSNSYYDESGNLVTADQDQYGYYGDTTATTATAAVDQAYPPQTVPAPTVSTTQSVDHQQYHDYKTPTTSAGTAKDSGQEQQQHEQEQSFDQYDNTDYYYAGGDQDYNYDYYGYGDDGKDYGAYDTGDYGEESGTYHHHQDDMMTMEGETSAVSAAADQYTNKPSQFQSSNNKKNKLHSLQSQSSVEYNYAYQSAENLSSSLPYEDALSQAKTSITVTTTTATSSAGATALSSSSHLDRANSSTRRASFRRQVTRDYGLDGGPDSRSHSFDAPSHPLDAAPTIASTAEKSETFRNGIKVTVQDTVDLGLGYSMSVDDDSYNPADTNWPEGYDYGHEDWKSSEDWNKSEDDRRYADDQKSHESQEQGYETQDTSRDNGPVHMDSLESNASDPAGRDPEEIDKFEAQYWQKQKERIAKQATLTAQDSFGYEYGVGNDVGAAFFEPVIESLNEGPSHSVIDQVGHHQTLSRMHSTEDWVSGGDVKKNSLDLEHEEWLSGLDRTGSQRSMRGSSANLISRQESIALDTHPEEDLEDDEYLIGGPRGIDDGRVGRKVSTDSAGLADTAAKLAMLNEIQDDTMITLREEGERKSSLEVSSGKDKATKSVSFDEEPPKMMVPERQTKGMTPREKWLWSMNRICSQLAVSSLLICFPYIITCCERQ